MAMGGEVKAVYSSPRRMKAVSESKDFPVESKSFPVPAGILWTGLYRCSE